MAQVTELLPSKWMALSSNSSTTTTTKKKKKKKRKIEKKKNPLTDVILLKYGYLSPPKQLRSLRGRISLACIEL
jgi:hypothetical protein